MKNQTYSIISTKEILFLQSELYIYKKNNKQFSTIWREQLQYKLSKLENNDRDKRQAFTLVLTFLERYLFHFSFYHPLYLWGKKVYYYFDKTASLFLNF